MLVALHTWHLAFVVVEEENVGAVLMLLGVAFFALSIVLMVTA